MSDSTNGTTSPLDGASQTDLNGEDSNMLNIHTVYMFFIPPIISRQVSILEHIPLWYDLAVKLGVPYAKVEAYRLDSATGGNRTLLYWRNGECGEDIPNTWGFLLVTVDHLNGPLVAKQLRDEANRHKHGVRADAPMNLRVCSVGTWQLFHTL